MIRRNGKIQTLKELFMKRRPGLLKKKNRIRRKKIGVDNPPLFRSVALRRC
jgi:hypothetical protein